MRCEETALVPALCGCTGRDCSLFAGGCGLSDHAGKDQGRLPGGGAFSACDRPGADAVDGEYQSGSGCVKQPGDKPEDRIAGLTARPDFFGISRFRLYLQQ